MNPRWLPILRWRAEMQMPGAMRADVLAGLVGAVVVLPQGIAFATLAGMPAQYGLYCAMVPCIVAALFGSSRLMVTGPANAISLTTLALIAPLAAPGSDRYIELVLTMSLLVGLVQLVLGFARLGKLVDWVPHSVIVGFTCGAAVLIASSQMGSLFGLQIMRGSSPFEVIRALIERWHQIAWPPVLIALLTLVSFYLAKPFDRRVPAMLVAVITGSLGAWALYRWGPQGLIPLANVEALPSPWPALSVPVLDMESLRALFAPVLVMTLLALTEASAIARSVALKHRDTLDSNQEFIGQGLANVAGAFFSAYPASGSFNRSAVNMMSGAKTPRAALFSALVLVLLLSVLAPAARFLPFVVISALLVIVAIGLFNLKEIQQVWGHGPAEWIPMLITFVATVGLSLEWAILLGILAAMLFRKRG
jgi:sulfate permease, SulP family